MDWSVKEARFERFDVESEEEAVIEPGIDDLREVNQVEQENGVVHEFRVEKETPVFEIVMNLEFFVEDSEEMDEDELRRSVGSTISSEGSFLASHFVRSMGLGPMNGILSDPEFLDSSEREQENGSKG